MDNNSGENPQKLIYLIAIGLLLLSLAGVTYLWSSKRSELNECNNNNLVLKSDMEGMNQMLEGYVGNISNDLKTDFNNMLETYDQLIEMDRSKADSINKQKANIQSLLDQLKNNKNLSARQLFNLRKENDVLRSIMRGYVREIDSLHTINTRLSTDLDNTNEKLTNTTTERDEFKKEAEEKTAQLKKGAKLSAYGFSSTALASNVFNKSVITPRAKNTVQMKCSFSIGENKIASAEKKIVYLQITDPNGAVLSNNSNHIVSTSNGSQAYSDKKEIDYNNQAVDLTIYYDFKGQNASKGNYKVKIYCDGEMIGTDNITLK